MRNIPRILSEGSGGSPRGLIGARITLSPNISLARKISSVTFGPNSSAFLERISMLPSPPPSVPLRKRKTIGEAPVLAEWIVDDSLRGVYGWEMPVSDSSNSLSSAEAHERSE